MNPSPTPPTPPDATRLPSSHCGQCGHKLDAATGAGHQERPAPGMLSVCIQCGHLALFADDLTLREATEAEINGLRASEVWPFIEHVRGLIEGARYMTQINTMAEQARAWQEAHPGVAALVQFNYPENTRAAVAVSEALALHLIYADAAGLEWIAATCAGFEGRMEATANMLRVALGISDEPTGPKL